MVTTELDKDRETTFDVLVLCYNRLARSFSDLDLVLQQNEDWNYFKFANLCLNSASSNFGRFSKSTERRSAVEALINQIQAQLTIHHLDSLKDHLLPILGSLLNDEATSGVELIGRYQQIAERVSWNWYNSSRRRLEDVTRVHEFVVRAGRGKKIFSLLSPISENSSIGSSSITLQFDPADFPFDFFLNLPTLILHEYLSHIHRQEFQNANTLSSKPSKFEDGWLYFIACQLTEAMHNDLALTRDEIYTRTIAVDFLRQEAQSATDNVGIGYRAARGTQSFIELQRFNQLSRLISRCPCVEANFADELVNEVSQILIRAKPSTSDARINRILGEKLQQVAQVFFNSEKYDEGSEAFQLAAVLDSEHADEHIVQMGDSFLKLGNYKSATAAYEQTLAVNPLNVMALIGYSKAEAYQSNFPMALKLLERAIAISPEDYQLWNEKGVLLFTSGHIEEALRSFERALELSPDDPIVSMNRAKVVAKIERRTKTNSRLGKH